MRPSGWLKLPGKKSAVCGSRSSSTRRSSSCWKARQRHRHQRALRVCPQGGHGRLSLGQARRHRSSHEQRCSPSPSSSSNSSRRHGAAAQAPLRRPMADTGEAAGKPVPIQPLATQGRQQAATPLVEDLGVVAAAVSALAVEEDTVIAAAALVSVVGVATAAVVMAAGWEGRGSVVPGPQHPGPLTSRPCRGLGPSGRTPPTTPGVWHTAVWPRGCGRAGAVGPARPWGVGEDGCGTAATAPCWRWCGPSANEYEQCGCSVFQLHIGQAEQATNLFCLLASWRPCRPRRQQQF